MQEHFHTEKLAPLWKNLREDKERGALHVALGDSLTCNASYTATGKGWVELLNTEICSQMENQRFFSINVGICGDRIDQLVSRFDTDVRRFDPDFITLCTGMNNQHSDEAEFEKDALKLLDMMQQTAEFILVRTPNPVVEYKEDGSVIIFEHESLEKKNMIIRGECEKRELPFIDLYMIWKRLESEGKIKMNELMTDPVHPNAKGALLQLECIAPYLELKSDFAYNEYADKQ